jgi:iron-sulfur cluster assembly protein
VVEDKGVKLLIEPTAAMFLLGTELDWHEDRLESRFVFNNPNVKGMCGCGESFTV